LAYTWHRTQDAYVAMMRRMLVWQPLLTQDKVSGVQRDRQNQQDFLQECEREGMIGDQWPFYTRLFGEWAGLKETKKGKATAEQVSPHTCALPRRGLQPRSAPLLPGILRSVRQMFVSMYARVCECSAL